MGDGASAAPPEPAPASVDAGWILSKLARPAPTRTDFVEVRGSALLKTPLRIEGQYRRPTSDTLVRDVRLPYAETTTIRNGEATIERDGKARTFSLSRAPELAGPAGELRRDARGRSHATGALLHDRCAAARARQWTLRAVAA